MSFAPPDPHGAAPLPPPPARGGLVPEPVDRRPARSGDLTFAWRVVLGIAWILAFFAYAGVWQASVQVGIGTWWLGPRAQPTEAWIRIIPFVLPLAVAMLLMADVRRPVWVSAGAALLAATISIPDFGRTASLGIVELVIAGALLLVSVAALAGRSRVPR